VRPVEQFLMCPICGAVVPAPHGVSLHNAFHERLGDEETQLEAADREAVTKALDKLMRAALR